MSSERISREEAQEIIQDMLDNDFPETEIRKVMYADHSMSYSQTNSILFRIKTTKPESDIVYFDGHPLSADLPEAETFLPPVQQEAINKERDRDVMIGFIILCIGLAAFLISYFARVDGFGVGSITGMGSILYGGWRLNRGLNS